MSIENAFVPFALTHPLVHTKTSGNAVESGDIWKRAPVVLMTTKTEDFENDDVTCPCASDDHVFSYGISSLIFTRFSMGGENAT